VTKTTRINQSRAVIALTKHVGVKTIDFEKGRMVVPSVDVLGSLVDRCSRDLIVSNAAEEIGRLLPFDYTPLGYGLTDAMFASLLASENGTGGIVLYKSSKDKEPIEVAAGDTKRLSFSDICIVIGSMVTKKHLSAVFERCRALGLLPKGVYCLVGVQDNVKDIVHDVAKTFKYAPVTGVMTTYQELMRVKESLYS